MKKFSFAVVISLFILGCNTAPSKEVVVNEDSILTTYTIDTIKADTVKVDSVVVKDSIK